MGWASWSVRAPWGLFNWQIGQEEITCLIVIWRPVPLKDLSSNLWKSFSPKWVVACKQLSNFHWRFPGRKRSPSSWNHPIWSSWKPSLLASRVSPSVYEGVSGKLVCGTKVATPIRPWFCNAALSCLISCLVPSCHFHAPFLVSFTAGAWNLSGQMDCLQEPEDLVTIFDWGPSGGQVASFFPNSSMCTSTRKAYLESV